MHALDSLQTPTFYLNSLNQQPARLLAFNGSYPVTADEQLFLYCMALGYPPPSYHLYIETAGGDIERFDDTVIPTKLQVASGGAVRFVSVQVASLTSLHPDDSNVSIICVAEMDLVSVNNTVRLQFAGILVCTMFADILMVRLAHC